MKALNTVGCGPIQEKRGSFLKKFGLPVAFLALLVMLTGLSIASGGTSSTDTTFNSIEALLRGWVEGSLGKALTFAVFLIAMGMGIMRNSAMGFIIAIVFAMVFAFGPTIIDTIFTFAI